MPLPKYAPCDQIWSDTQPMLHITPEKHCAMPYLNGLNCAECNFSPQQLAKYNCMVPGFNGRPVHFEYSVESGDDWKNARCVGDACGVCKQPEVL